METVGAIEPGALDYTLLLSDFSEDLDGDVSDPIGGDLATYARTYDHLLAGIEAMLAGLDRFYSWKKG
jgi:hypothetical protein